MLEQCQVYKNVLDDKYTGVAPQLWRWLGLVSDTGGKATQRQLTAISVPCGPDGKYKRRITFNSEAMLFQLEPEADEWSAAAAGNHSHVLEAVELLHEGLRDANNILSNIRAEVVAALAEAARAQQAGSGRTTAGDSSGGGVSSSGRGHFIFTGASPLLL